PLEGISSGNKSFSKLDYPDNFFDVVVSGSSYSTAEADWQEYSIHALQTRVARCLVGVLSSIEARVSLSVVKAHRSGWIDILTSSSSFQSDGPITKSYESRLLSCLDQKNFYPNP